MSQRSEKPLLGLDNTGSFWIIHYQTNSDASTFIINKTGSNIGLEELLDTKSESLQSEKLQELEVRYFEKAWYIEDIQAFEIACGVACAQRLRENRPPGSKLNRWDWVVEDVDLSKGLLDKANPAPSRAEAGSMSKRLRDSSPESQPWSKRRPLEKDAPFFAHADTYRPNYGPKATESVSPSTKTRRESNFSTSSSPRDRGVNDGVGKSNPNDHLDQAKRPMQQLRQMHASSANGLWKMHRETSSAAPKNPSGGDRYQSNTDSTSMSFDFSGVPRGPKHNSRPRQPQSTFTQQRKYQEALDEKHPCVIRQEDALQLKDQPHIFISSSHLPFLPSTIPHLQRLVNREFFASVTVKAELSGWYLVFPATKSGKRDLRQCFEKFNKSLLFGEYTLHMDPHVDGETTAKYPSKKNGEKVSQKRGESILGSESRLEGPIALVDGPAVSHLRPKADDEISMSSTAAPSEISSGTTRAKTHCAECKNAHFPAYNPKHSCSTCPRHYHLMCRKPQLKISEDPTTWQCNYCIKKKRPKPAPTQRNVQTESSASAVLESSSLHNLIRNANQQPGGQIRMGVVSQAMNGTVQGEKGKVTQMSVAKEVKSHGAVLDPRLHGRTLTRYPRIWDGAANGAATPPESHEHSSKSWADKVQQLAVHDHNALDDVQRKMQQHSGFPKEPDAPTQENIAEAHKPDTQFPTQKTNLGGGLHNQKEHIRDEQVMDNGSMLQPSEEEVQERLQCDGQQADLEPEIPDLSLEIPEASTGNVPARIQNLVGRFSEEISRGKIWQSTSVEIQASSSKPQPEKRNSLVRCSTCGKIIFSKVAKAEDPTCASCKNQRQPAKEDGAREPWISEKAEEVWRRRLEPGKRQLNGHLSPHQLNGHPSPTAKPAGDPGPSQLNREASTLEQSSHEFHDDTSTQPTEAQVKATNGGAQGPRDPSPAACETPSAVTNPTNMASDGESEDAEVMDQSAQAVSSGGPSFEASRLVRRARSPVNENINNDTAGMGSDHARSAIGSRGSKSTHGHAENDALSLEPARDSSDLSAPCAKLPASFSWPELIGFALAEASDHRMTAAQVHQWIVDNVEGYEINNTTHRSSIAATLSQQKAKFPKDDAIMEGSRQLSRWRLAPEFVSGYKTDLKAQREMLRKERSLQGARSSFLSRRKESNDFAKSSHGPSLPRPTSQQKDASKPPPQSTETPMFTQRHRVAYDADGRDIVAGFKDIPIERWTELAEVESFRAKGVRFYVGDYIKAPLPNRFKFADYTHKPLVQTIAQIEEIRQRRDEPGYAVLVQWFVTKEAAEWWKCRHVKSLWPKDEKSGMYVPATVWDVLTSDFIAEQEKSDPEETRRDIIPNLFFELDTEVWLLYLKEGRGPISGPGVAFGPRSPFPAEQEAENTEAGLERTDEHHRSTSRHSALFQERNAAQSRITLRTKSTAKANQPSKQGPIAKPPNDQSQLSSHKQVTTIKTRRPVPFVEAMPIPSEQSQVRKSTLERTLFTPSPSNGPIRKDSSTTEPRLSKVTSKARRRETMPSAEPAAKRQKTTVTLDEQTAVRAFLLKEQRNAKYEVKDLFAAAPDYDPEKAAWDREAKIAEIKARPSRKARFTRNLDYARHERPPHALYVEVDRQLPKAYKAPPPNRPGSGYSNPEVARATNDRRSSRGNINDDTWRFNSDPDTDMPDEATQATSTSASMAFTQQTAMTNGSSEFDPNKPEIFDTLEELLGLPSNLVPTLYEGRLAFRDGTMGADGKLPRAKKVFKVGRNVPGELK